MQEMIGEENLKGKEEMWKAKFLVKKLRYEPHREGVKAQGTA
ncbi:MAG: hypothetical protein WHS46_09080 [Desulfosoma sp.]